MNIEIYTDVMAEILKDQGSKISVKKLKQIKEKLKYYENTLYQNIVFDQLELLQKQSLTSQKVVYGDLSTIHLKKDEYTIINGSTNTGEKINENTLFDVASITKMFTLLLTFRLSELHIISLEDKIDYLFSNLKNWTIEDLLTMKGEIRTPKRIDQCQKYEAEQILKDVYIPQEKKYVYSDIPMILLSKIIENKVNQKFNTNFSYDEIMNIFLCSPFQLEATFESKENIAGNGKGTLCYDPKAKILGPIGSAGLFVSSQCFIDLTNKFSSIITEENRKYFTTKVYEEFSRSFGGMYQKFDDFSKTYVPLEYSKDSFASEGSTGSVFVYDQYFQIHNHILVDAIECETGKKNSGYGEIFNQFHQLLTDETLLLFLAKEYYENFKSKDDIKIAIKK